jgi:hypothetical protein
MTKADSPNEVREILLKYSFLADLAEDARGRVCSTMVHRNQVSGEDNARLETLGFTWDAGSRSYTTKDPSSQ